MKFPKLQFSAFSLLELLAVLALLAILTAVLAPSLSGIGSAQRLTAASESAAGALDLARQIAAAENLRVECRIWKMPSAVADQPVFRAFQIFRMEDGKPLSRRTDLPEGCEIWDRLEYSTLVSSENPLGGSADCPPRGTLDYKSVVFRPDGSTHLSPDAPAAGSNAWSLTIVRTADTAGGTLPRNFVTLAVDPVTGRVAVWRP